MLVVVFCTEQQQNRTISAENRPQNFIYAREQKV